MEEGIVLYPGGGTVDGSRGDHVLIAPPLTITKEQIDEMFEGLEKGIRRTVEEVG
jgi:adenosylmethionine-8-amino-7-oxononanoate aminotransferase